MKRLALIVLAGLSLGGCYSDGYAPSYTYTSPRPIYVPRYVSRPVVYRPVYVPRYTYRPIYRPVYVPRYVPRYRYR